jgi:hypothetical protein
VVTWSCAGWDDPTALADLNPEVQFDIEGARIETLEEVEVHVHVTDGGAPMHLDRAQLEITRGVGEPRVVELEPAAEGDGYEAHVVFYEEGEYDLQLMGMPERHRLMAQMGEHKLQVYRQHRIIGPYWAELEVAPVPVYEDSTAHIHILVYDLLADSTRGDPATGLDVAMEVHAPDGTETLLVTTEESAGEYEGGYTFGEAGIYELHVAIDVGGVEETGEFHIPVMTLVEDTATDDHDETGGQGHGH